MSSSNSGQDLVPLVCDLDLTRYLGKWYEVGKLSAKEQKGLDNVPPLIL